MALFESGPPWTALARYNAERSRGIVHTPEWAAAMAEEQARFDAFQEERLAAEGWVEIAPGMYVGRGERRGRWLRGR